MLARCIVGLVLPVSVLGHAYFTDPPARHLGQDKLKQYPCGTGSQYNNFTMGGVTQMAPGVQALTFFETINHVGAPYRLAISTGSDDLYDTHVLLDHIPHNDQGNPASMDNPKKHRVWIDVPDIDCSSTNCALQLVQVMTDKFKNKYPGSVMGVCPPEELQNSCGNSVFVYFSCANVEINGTKTLNDVGTFYSAFGGETEAYGWQQESATWVQAADGFWELPGNKPETDRDCNGTWSACDAECDRSWTTTVQPVGGGSLCPTLSPNCKPGDDSCPELPLQPDPLTGSAAHDQWPVRGVLSVLLAIGPLIAMTMSPI